VPDSSRVYTNQLIKSHRYKYDGPCFSCLLHSSILFILVSLSHILDPISHSSASHSLFHSRNPLCRSCSSMPLFVSHISRLSIFFCGVVLCINLSILFLDLLVLCLWTYQDSRLEYFLLVIWLIKTRELVIMKFLLYALYIKYYFNFCRILQFL
jgi:hypothetical protein